MPTPLTVLVADDHSIVRQGLCALLERADDIVVVAEAENGREAVRLAVDHRPDVAILDLAMPQMNGVDAAERIRADAPGTKVIALSMHSSDEYVFPAVAAGAMGYLLKGSGIGDLVAAVRAVANGKAFFSPDVAAVLARARRGDRTLTTREREVLQLVVEGRSSVEIGQELGVSSRTVEGHRARIMRKLDIHDVPGLVKYAIRVGISTLDA